MEHNTSINRTIEETKTRLFSSRRIKLIATFQNNDSTSTSDRLRLVFYAPQRSSILPLHPPVFLRYVFPFPQRFIRETSSFRQFLFSFRTTDESFSERWKIVVSPFVPRTRRGGSRDENVGTKVERYRLEAVDNRRSDRTGETVKKFCEASMLHGQPRNSTLQNWHVLLNPT